MPFGLEYRLINKYKFRIHSRIPRQWVLFEKEVVPPMASDFSDLPEGIQTELLRKVNKIVNAYQDPESNKERIKLRCLNLARTLLPKQRDFVKDWVRRVIDEDGDPPWEDESYTPPGVSIGDCC